MKSSSSSVDIDEYLVQEEDDFIKEPEYAGITASWLRKAITILSQVAELNSHKKYKSAVKIQSIYRGWITRKKISSLNQSAIKIQKTYRGYLGRHKYFQILESTIQKKIFEHLNKSATIIQCTFRGYYSRIYSHDHLKLKKLQLKVTSELLQCVALQARKLYKNQLVPGLFPLRNSKCQTKVEILLAVLKLKTYNEKVRKARTAEVMKLNKAFEQSVLVKDQIPIPFGKCETVKAMK
ncbi:abnormal spindle-like microcephaly-associated protein homolog [Episyrphus balteatus]|uniref:abnormal spindle-like microcephaly-associated protein homolog n=1 Tax=Episyrphus balteatus TaxID=286459 RepID=UPI002485381B|nr:abnormal spindle-like microcephaly-associated protein homolog [Episyrphus balteatus]